MGTVGGAIMSLARREDVEAMRRGLWGEGGKELRSGAMSPEMLRCADFLLLQGPKLRAMNSEVAWVK